MFMIIIAVRTLNIEHFWEKMQKIAFVDNAKKHFNSKYLRRAASTVKI